MASEARWYVVHTYSGYENKVRDSILKTVANRGMQELVKEVEVPVEESIEDYKGQQRSVVRKVFPGYVLVHMVMTDETWYIIRNARGVTGFVGPGSKPVPLSDEEVKRLSFSFSEMDLGFEPGDSVTIISGDYEDSVGEVAEIRHEDEVVVVELEIFGRKTPVELGFGQVKKI